MLVRAALIACLAVVLVAGCSGGDSDDPVTLVPSSFTEVVRAELIGAGLEAEPGRDLKLTASQGPNLVDLDLADAFQRYEEDPDSRDAIVGEVVAGAEQRLEEGIGNLSFEEARADLMPLLKARFELRTYGFEPVETEYPAALAAIYVVDADDAFTIVEPEDLERWGTTAEELHEVALSNLLRQTNEEEPLLCEPSGDQKLCGWASGDGYDATRMIVPELRHQIERENDNEPVAYAVPMENVYVALPLALVTRGQTERLFRLQLQRDFQRSEDPLSPEVFVERNGELVVLK